MTSAFSFLFHFLFPLFAFSTPTIEEHKLDEQQSLLVDPLEHLRRETCVSVILELYTSFYLIVLCQINTTLSGGEFLDGQKKGGLP